MDSTPDPKSTKDVLVARADEQLSRVHDQISQADEQLARVTEQLAKMERDGAGGPSPGSAPPSPPQQPPPAGPARDRSAVAGVPRWRRSRCPRFAVVPWRRRQAGGHPIRGAARLGRIL